MKNVAEIVYIPFKAGDLKAEMRIQSDGIMIDVTSSLAMRPDVAAWSFATKDKKVASRLLACIQAGKAFKDYHIMTDVAGQTYVSARQAGFFHGKHMKVALKSLGY